MSSHVKERKPDSFCLYVIAVCLAVVVTSSENYVLEVRVVVDLAGVQQWTGNSIDDFRLEINETFLDVSQIYFKSLARYQLFIDIVIKDIVLLDFNLVTPIQGHKVNGWSTLKAFKGWALGNNTVEVNRRYDASVLLTGYYLFIHDADDSGVTFGYSYVGQVCFPGGVAVVELSGSKRQNALIIAHEIGHILGATHDGTGDASDCSSSSSMYVMNKTANLATDNHPYFSPCSAHAFKTKIGHMDNNTRNCLDRRNY